MNFSTPGKAGTSIICSKRPVFRRIDILPTEMYLINKYSIHRISNDPGETLT